MLLKLLLFAIFPSTEKGGRAKVLYSDSYVGTKASGWHARRIALFGADVLIERLMSHAHPGTVARRRHCQREEN